MGLIGSQCRARVTVDAAVESVGLNHFLERVVRYKVPGYLIRHPHDVCQLTNELKARSTAAATAKQQTATLGFTTE